MGTSKRVAVFRATLGETEISVGIAHRRPALQLRVGISGVSSDATALRATADDRVRGAAVDDGETASAGTLYNVIEKCGDVARPSSALDRLSLAPAQADLAGLASYGRSSAAAEFVLVIDGAEHRGWRYVLGNEVYVRLGSRTFTVTRSGDESEGGGTGGKQHAARADMPGVVVAIHCSAGQSVRNGDKLVTIESMKLQTTLVASHEAVVERVHVSPDATFERGAVLVTFAQPAE